VAANTLGSINISLPHIVPLGNIFVWTVGGTMATIQLSSMSNNNLTVQYRFEGSQTNRMIYYIYFI